jgi:hypothetical protein
MTGMNSSLYEYALGARTWYKSRVFAESDKMQMSSDIWPNHLAVFFLRIKDETESDQSLSFLKKLRTPSIFLGFILP